MLTGGNSLAEADRHEFSFFSNEKYLPALRTTQAGAVLVPTSVPTHLFSNITGPAFIGVENPSLAFAQAMERFAPPPEPFTPGIHPTAVISPEAQLDPAAVRVGPHVVVEAGAVIGPETSLGAGCYIGAGVHIGRGCLLHPRTTVLHGCVLGDRVILHSGVVIGSDGFGFEMVGARREKVPQRGIVRIGNDVEIGANSCVDRARFGETRIGNGTKIDNLVQIAHNVVIGENCVLAAQCGVAGSTRLGDGVILAAQSGVAGHLELASGVILTAQSGVNKSLRQPGAYMGFHAEPMRKMLRILAVLHQLPELLQRVRRLEKKAAE